MTNFNPTSGSNGNNSGSGSGGSGSNGGQPSGTMPSNPWGIPDDDDFDPQEFLINYNEKFKNEKPTMFRDAVIQQTLSCLIGKFKPNAIDRKSVV